MERTVKLSELTAAIDGAYDKYKNERKGEVDPRLRGVDAKLFGISVILSDGTVVNKGDISSPFPIGNIMRVPTATLLLQQNTVRELLEKSGLKHAKCSKECNPDPNACNGQIKSLPLNALNVRLVSAVEPTSDPDGKMDVIVDNLTNMLGSPAILDDRIYKTLADSAAAADEENILAKNSFFLYDSAADALDIEAKYEALTVTAEQLATMGATLAADGYNPVTRQNVFNGSISERVVGMMAGFGPARHKSVPWLVSAGIPAMAGFGGGVLAVVPGLMAIAAYSPLTNHHGVSHKALHAVRHIANTIGLNIFASARVSIVK